MSSSRNPRKSSAHRQRALERRVARLERIIGQQEPAQQPIIYLAAQVRCPLCGQTYPANGFHYCWTVNPRYPYGYNVTSTGITTINAQWWANTEGSGGILH